MKTLINKKILLSGTVLFGAYLLLAVDDVIDDINDHVPQIHIIANIAFITAAVFALIFFVYFSYLEIRAEVQRRDSATLNVIKHSEELATQISNLRAGVTQTIKDRFINWSFTDAEIEIGFLILKGFSFKEIGNIRSTSEKTVRDQASKIYKKSETKNRSEFVAFFLEDLLQ